MKAKYALIVLAIGYCIDFIAVAIKIMHWASADLLLTSAVIFKVVGALTLLYKIITYPKFKEFFNS
ncbi:hypothetical protein LVD15_05715 [Fulvivirga maritima]|uniref:hypothetical protein n=1 Tax=Fulvivirga maritima TaxID=2904247 RepID=UPI001F1E65D7|nr:hypothetical protein [Fulvivirga maritima]UII27917.1 hypothetical protein LVD15_05715 [Fulvivirga maritima]